MSSSPRREFLGQLATAAVALAGTACAAPAIATQQQAAGPAPTTPPAPSTPPAKVVFDDSWTTRLTGKHKAVFDSPEIGGGVAIYHAQMWMSGFKDVLGTTDADTNAVLVLRHAAVPMVINSAMWEKYEIGRLRKIKNEETKQFHTSNPYQKQLEAMLARGTVVLGCNVAAMGVASMIASERKLDREAVRQEIRENLVPGALLMPSGIYAVHRAQEAGCTFLKSI